MFLHSTQSIVAKDTHRFRVVNCGRRWGKTTLAVEEMKGKALSRPNKIAYIAPTYQQARDIAWEQLKKELQGAIVSINQARLEIVTRTVQGGESLIVLRGWESIETLRGQSFDFIVADEISSMRNFWISWQEVIRPTLTDRKGEVLFISTPKGFNHFYELFNLESKDNDFKSFHFTSYDNPTIPADEIDKARQQLTEDRFAQEYLADFRKTEGLVYKEFDRDRHIYEPNSLKVSFVESIAGVDFGFTHPCAVISIGKDADGNYYVTQEWYKTGRTEAQIAEYVRSCSFNAVYPDPESPSAIQALVEKRVPVIEVNKNKDSVRNGINIVRELFKRNRLKISRDCVNLIAELETYSYAAKGDGMYEPENPVKEHDDALDALRYALMTDSGDSVADEVEIAQRLMNRLQSRVNQAR